LAPSYDLDPNLTGDFLSAFFPSPGGPLVADGDTAIDFSRFGTFYEPQGELAPLAAAPPPATPTFDQPVPISGPFAGPTVFPAPTIPAPIAPPAPDAGPAAGATSRGPMTSRAGLKRKAGAASLAASGAPSPTSAAKRPAVESSRSSATMRVPPSSAAHSPASALPDERPSRAAAGKAAAAAAARAGDIVARLSPVLPAGKLFPIRIGSELFQLSGASISSDGTSPSARLRCTKLSQPRLISRITLEINFSRVGAEQIR
jgi:hypothetical protein